MQDPYAGDIGDHGKFVLLRAIARTTDLPLGLHWCLTSAGAQATDGRHISYLNTPRGERRYRSSDPELYDKLRLIVASGTRSVAALESASLLPEPVCYFGERLDYDGIPLGQRRSHREAWLGRAVAALKECAVVLLDPDNGLEVASVGITDMKAPKYVFVNEIRELARGRSVIVYQHLHRSGSGAEQIRRRLAEVALDRDAFAVRHHRGTGRAYLFFPLAEHRDRLLRAVEAALATWPKDFSIVA